MKKNKHWTEEAEKVFISGKITGEPIDECLDKFIGASLYIFGLEKKSKN